MAVGMIAPSALFELLLLLPGWLVPTDADLGDKVVGLTVSTVVEPFRLNFLEVVDDRSPFRGETLDGSLEEAEPRGDVAEEFLDSEACPTDGDKGSLVEIPGIPEMDALCGIGAALDALGAA
jgi:hypothetical protein